MADQMRVYEAAAELGLSEIETLHLLGPEILTGEALNQTFGRAVQRYPLAERNRMSLVERNEVDALKRQLARRGRRLPQVALKEGVILRGARIVEEPPDPGPIVVVSNGVAAMLSLTEACGNSPYGPAERFTIEITPPLSGLKAIEVAHRKMTPLWTSDVPVNADLRTVLQNIVYGACRLLNDASTAREVRTRHEPAGERALRMREVIVVKIKTKVSIARGRLAADVLAGRRGYSNVLTESIEVRAHWATFCTGVGRRERARRFRRAHMRGDGSVKTGRAYVLKP